MYLATEFVPKLTKILGTRQYQLMSQKISFIPIYIETHIKYLKNKRRSKIVFSLYANFSLCI